ncbi:MAG: Holliday junction branch migration protein RuvA [Pseudomonadales bacterium]|nr:Holliday junction branch migration protein RuvA [Pseudomonadales bacterium]MCP5215319.1 Holliday junction branch migration protein RuvA [Pseudomonadales bacterium]
MIGRIKGRLAEKTPPDILIDVNGVGYELQVPMNTFYRLPELNEEVLLHTHFVVREDAQLLYGFYDVRERSLFRELIKINGVGPKLGLAILSGIESNEFVRVVRNNDVNALVCLPGIGKKTAERLIIEMRDKLKDWQSDASDDSELNSAGPFGTNQAIGEAESALVALGYKPKEAERAVKSVASEGMSNQDLIRNALKVMAKP